MSHSQPLAAKARLALVLLAVASLAACATPRYPSHMAGAGSVSQPGQGRYKVGDPYQVGGVWYVPREQPDYDVVGIASWYGDAFHLKATANGEIFDMNAVSGAHTTLPLPSIVEVTNLDNGRKLAVRVNDRGPFVGDRIIDLSHEAARQLGYDRKGLARVRVRYLGPAPLTGPADGYRVADAAPTRRAPAAVAAAPAYTAARGALRSAPTAPPAADDPAMSLAAGAPAEAAGATAPAAAPIQTAALPPGSAPVAVSDLPPITGSAISDTPIAGQGALAVRAAAPTVSTAAPAVVQTASVASPLRVQAGAFASAMNAQAAVARLAPAGVAVIEPVERDGMTLYRVVLPAPADEAAAYALRDRVAEIGFAEARVVRTF